MLIIKWLQDCVCCLFDLHKIVNKYAKSWVRSQMTGAEDRHSIKKRRAPLIIV